MFLMLNYAEFAQVRCIKQVIEGIDQDGTLAVNLPNETFTPVVSASSK
jgi:hypothetical protein